MRKPYPRRNILVMRNAPGGQVDGFITVDTLAGLNNALSDAEPPITGLLLALVLPTTSLSDCQVLKDAAIRGSYNGIRFTVLGHAWEDLDTLEAKICSRHTVAESHGNIDAVVGSLARAERSYRPRPAVVQPWPPSAPTNPTTAAGKRAKCGNDEWVLEIERVREDVRRQIQFRREQIRGALARLDIV
ncbi:hypothetical protein U9M48_006855 [Paspalum notatum var. saurae]